MAYSTAGANNPPPDAMISQIILPSVIQIVVFGLLNFRFSTKPHLFAPPPFICDFRVHMNIVPEKVISGWDIRRKAYFCP